jgi:hypothetical protein
MPVRHPTSFDFIRVPEKWAAARTSPKTKGMATIEGAK